MQSNHQGNLSAYTRIAVVDIFGRQRCSRVSLGRQYGMTLEDAANTVKEARESNRELHLEATFTVNL